MDGITVAHQVADRIEHRTHRMVHRPARRQPDLRHQLGRLRPQYLPLGIAHVRRVHRPAGRAQAPLGRRTWHPGRL